MRPRIVGASVVSVLVMTLVAPASAANKEHQQLMADIRMLQEQAQLLQNMLGTLNESIKAVNTRLEEQNNAVRKAFADQKLQIDNLGSDLRVVREKVDDNNVRIGTLTQELEALRQSVQHLAARPSTIAEAASPMDPSAPPAATSPGTQPGASPIPPGMSPTKSWDMAYADFTLGQWDLAIQGFDSYLRYFPKSDRASEAQVKIGQSYDMAGNKAKALDAYDKAIRDYPSGSATPEAYFRKGAVLLDLKQADKAKDAWDYLVKNYPESDAARIAKQRLDQMKKL